MRTLPPFFRTDPENTQPIRFWPLATAYLAILVIVPLLSGLNLGLFTVIGHVMPFAGEIPPDLRVLITAPYLVLFGLAWSPVFAWPGALMSLPLVWLANRLGWMGWMTATLAGVLVFQICWQLFIGQTGGTGEVEWLLGTIGSGILGLTFWITLWLIQPGAICSPDAGGRRYYQA